MTRMALSVTILDIPRRIHLLWIYRLLHVHEPRHLSHQVGSLRRPRWRRHDDGLGDLQKPQPRPAAPAIQPECFVRFRDTGGPVLEGSLEQRNRLHSRALHWNGSFLRCQSLVFRRFPTTGPNVISVVNTRLTEGTTYAWRVKALTPSAVRITPTPSQRLHRSCPRRPQPDSKS